jgi:hypothetical protein
MAAVQLRVAFLLFKYIFREELRDRLPEILSLLDELARKRSGLEYLETVLRYLSRGTDKLKPDDLPRAVTQALTRGDEIMPTIAEQWIQQGIQQGVPQGEVLLLKRQLQRRFGPLPEWVSEKLAQADQTSLETWADRVLDAGSLEEVFTD